VRRHRIILDPGIGFSKTEAQNLELLRRFAELRDWQGFRGMPWLVGPTRKGFVGRITGVAKARERKWGTAALLAGCVREGVDVVRVHDVGEMAQVVRMSEAVYRVEKEEDVGEGAVDV
jgi:2-amino-4-hydroxy-6-hydroxymethyldihydropteridine diphosphokinase/dihydropteroate synthase